MDERLQVKNGEVETDKRADGLCLIHKTTCVFLRIFYYLKKYVSQFQGK